MKNNTLLTGKLSVQSSVYFSIVGALLTCGVEKKSFCSDTESLILKTNLSNAMHVLNN